jgi:acyl carrier protein
MTRWRGADGKRYAVAAMASYEESLQITCQLLRRHVAETIAIRPQDHIQNDLGLDSLGVMELVADVETKFGVSIPSEMFEKIETVADVARAVTQLQRA